MRLPDRATSWAVLIGIDRYRHLPALSGVHAGAAALAGVLTDSLHGCVPPEQCILLPEDASAGMIGDGIARAADYARDLLLIYFAGHGVLGARRGELHLAVNSTHPNRPGIGGIPFDAVRDLYVDSPAVARVVILDCCYSGRALGTNQSPDGPAILNEIVAEGTAVLTSAPPNGISKKLDAETYPAYTHRLIRLLREGIPNAGPLLTLPMLHRRLCRELAEVGLRQPQADLNPLLDHLALLRNRAEPVGLPIEGQLIEALDADQLTLHYQPDIDLCTGDIVGVEALVRWNHPTEGFLSAMAFVPAAERAGLASRLGWWVIRRACTDFAEWYAGIGAQLLLRINVSPFLLDEPTFVDDLGAMLQGTGLRAESVCIEIVEREGTDFDATVATVRALKRLGVQVAIDSFGTYNSSLSMIQRLPVDSLEIDRTFVQGLADNTDDIAIVQAIISMARSFGLGVSAAGIETPAAARALLELGCDRGQGYLYSRPVSREDMTALIAAGPIRPCGPADELSMLPREA
ncbi:EAL domain-containing protein [Nocardia nova]|uniref:EAL domain-containing protein n=1 Tax=Nocardia nova TaxID=37330 RepID=UPI001C48FA87|nr:EAL domain-containing protein [Nocardia nova]MBV7703975.1 EAL domain-containing protein [Nocardia nova]